MAVILCRRHRQEIVRKYRRNAGADQNGARQSLRPPAAKTDPGPGLPQVVSAPLSLCRLSQARDSRKRSTARDTTSTLLSRSVSM